MTITHTTIWYHSGAEVVIFRSGEHTVYATAAEAAPLLERGSYTWREVCALPGPAAATRSQQQKRESLAKWAGEPAAAAAFPMGNI